MVVGAGVGDVVVADGDLVVGSDGVDDVVAVGDVVVSDIAGDVVVGGGVVLPPPPLPQPCKLGAIRQSEATAMTAWKMVAMAANRKRNE